VLTHHSVRQMSGTLSRFRTLRSHDGPETAVFGHSAWSFCGVQNEGFGRCTAARFLGKMKWQQIGAT